MESLIYLRAQGKPLLITVALAYGSTLIAGSCSYLVSSGLFPSFMSEGALDQIAATAGVSVDSYFSISITGFGHAVGRSSGFYSGSPAFL